MNVPPEQPAIRIGLLTSPEPLTAVVPSKLTGAIVFFGVVPLRKNEKEGYQREEWMGGEGCTTALLTPFYGSLERQKKVEPERAFRLTRSFSEKRDPATNR